MGQQSVSRGDVREFLTSRRARIAPAEAGLPTSDRRRVTGLRREEVAVLAGVSTEWYTRLERGHIGGVSEDVLDAVARTLRLDDDERTYLFDLARSSRRERRAPSRGEKDAVPHQVQWLLDSMTMSSAFVRNGRTDVIATNALARALFAPMFHSAAVDERRRPNIARYVFLDSGARDFFVDWGAAGVATAALLRAEAGRDRGLRELVSQLCSLSPEFRRVWAAHDVMIRHDGVKRLNHPEVGQLELSFQSLDLPISGGAAAHTVVTYTAEPGTPCEDQLALLASRAAE